jgi:hypothetical protein
MEYFRLLMYEVKVTCLYYCRYLAKILIPSGTKDVQVGRDLCVIVSLHHKSHSSGSFCRGSDYFAIGMEVDLG